MAAKSLKHFFKYVVIDILLAALISFFLINYVVSAYKVDGGSMEPLLRDQERILISKLGINKDHLRRFDIVVLFRPDEPDKSLVKRIIGLPEEIIEIRAGEVYINDKPLKQPWQSDNPEAMRAPGDMKALLIPHGMFFVMGDNRRISLDSRQFGLVPQKYIFGKAFFRYWPFAAIGKIE
ncbi:MAG: signal peptidase I [Candidatus Aminicenantes bacterium]|nr:signal peptidase I [Candidatus Aminicenantes bacterium]